MAMPKGDFRAEKDQIYSLVGYDTNQGGKQVYVKPGTYVPGISATPWTPPTQTSTNQTALPEETVKQSYGDFITPETAEEKAYRTEMERQQAIAQGLATETLDEATIRSNTEKQFQAEIDALNRVYAEKKRQLAVEGQGRVGSATSVQARRGLIGSDFGSAQTEQVKQYNQQIIDEAEAERAAKEANIWARARNAATQEYQSKLAAKQQGAEAYLEFLKGAAERKANTVKQTVANMLSEGVDIDSLDSDGLAKELGISVAELKRQYNSAKSEAESAAAKAAQEGAFTLGEGQLRYDAQGNLIAAGMAKQEDNTKVVGGNLLERDANGKWRTIFTAPKEGKELSISEQISLMEKGYTVDENGNITKKSMTLTPGQIEQASDIVTLADIIESHKGKNSAVGINPFSRGKVPVPLPFGLGFQIPYGADYYTGANADFIGKVQQLADQLTLAKLIEVKGQGATFGALSDSERAVIERAATPINQWKVTNDKGEVIGYKIDQDSFDREIERLKQEYNIKISPQQSGEEDPLGIISSQPFNSVGNTSASNYLKNYGPVTGEGSPYWKWGLDVDLKKGDPVYTPVSGTVVFAGNNGGFGNQVQIKTPQGNIVMLSHLDGINVKKGQTIKANDFIGKGGNTGKTIAVGGGDGSHLDITVKKPDGSYYTAAEVRQRLS
jgi:murein DD-endopeptidase MepM/ murein hydrolase activator NlpD